MADRNRPEDSENLHRRLLQAGLGAAAPGAVPGAGPTIIVQKEIVVGLPHGGMKAG